MAPLAPRSRLAPRDSWHAPCTFCSRSAHATVGRGEVAQSGTGETTTAANKWPKDVAAGVRADEPLQSLVPRENFSKVRSWSRCGANYRKSSQVCGLDSPG